MIVRAGSFAATIVGTPPVAQSFLISGAGDTLTPKAALIRGTSGTALGTLVAAARMLLGQTDGTTSRALGAMAENNQIATAQDCRTRIATAHVLDAPLGASGAVNGLLSFSSFAAGGMNGSWGDLLNAASLICPTYFFGDDVQAAVVEFAGDATQNVEKTISGLAFAPDMVIAYSHYSAYAADSDSADARSCIGYAVKTITGAIQQFGNSTRDSDRTAGFLGAHQIYDNRLVVNVGSVTDGASLELTAWTSDGAKITTRDASASVSTALLFLGFGGRRKLYAGVLPTTDPGGGAPWLDTSTTGVKALTVGFDPLAYFLVGTKLASKNATNRTNGTRSHYSDGVWSGFEELSVGWGSGDTQGAGGTNSATVGVTTAKIASVPTATSGTLGIDWEGNHDSVAPNGPSINVTTASAAARMVGLCVIGAVETPGLILPQRRWRRQLARM